MNALRADQVGSLLRPPALLQARIDRSAGRLDRDGLRAEEDLAVLDVLRKQRDCGLDVCTDGELRRASFVGGFIDAVEGFAAGRAPGRFERVVAGRLRARERIAGVESAFLCEHVTGTWKVTLPSPLTLTLLTYRRGVTDAVYATPEELVGDAARILAEEAGQLAADGTPYVQLDAPAYAQWLAPDLLAGHRAGGVDTDRLLDAAIAADNRVLDAARAGGAITAVHVCRSDCRGGRLAEGGYDRIAERLFAKLRCHRLLLEYDSGRAGGFGPLRFVPASRVVVLGLITSRTGALEPRDELLRRIDEASRIVPLERLALSPQCGFASRLAGNPLTPDDQWRKLDLVASLAREVWP